MSDREKLLSMAKAIRTSLEPGLQRRQDGTCESKGSCLHASLLLCFSLNKFGVADADMRGGDGLQDGGALGTDGRWHGHYWIEAATPAGQFVVDITADQFGHAALYVELSCESGGRYKPGRQDLVDCAAVSLAESFGDKSLVKNSVARLPACHAEFDSA